MASADGGVAGARLAEALSPQMAKGSTHSLLQQAFVDMLRPTAHLLQEVQEEVRELQRSCAQLHEQAGEHGGRLDRHAEEMSAAERLLREEVRKVDHKLDQQRGTLEELGAAQRKQEVELAHGAQRLDEEAGRLRRDLEHFQEDLLGLKEVRNDTSDNSRSLRELGQKCSFLEEVYEGVNARQLESAKEVRGARSDGEAAGQEVRRVAKELKQQLKDATQPIVGLAVRVKDTEDAIRSTKCDILSQTALVKEHFTPIKNGIDELRARQDVHAEAHERLARQQLEVRQLAEGLPPRVDELLSRVRLSEGVAASSREEIAPVRDKVQSFESSFAQMRCDIELLQELNLPHERQERMARMEEQGQEMSEELRRQKSRHESVAAAAQETRDRLESTISAIHGMEAQDLGHDARLLAVEGRARQNAEGLEAMAGDVRQLERGLGPIAPELSRLGQSIELAHDHLSGLVTGVEEARRKIHAGEDDMIPLKPKTRKLPSLPSSQRAGCVSPSFAATPSTRRSPNASPEVVSVTPDAASSAPSAPPTARPASVKSTPAG